MIHPFDTPDSFSDDDGPTEPAFEIHHHDEGSAVDVFADGSDSHGGLERVEILGAFDTDNDQLADTWLYFHHGEHAPDQLIIGRDIDGDGSLDEVFVMLQTGGDPSAPMPPHGPFSPGGDFPTGDEPHGHDTPAPHGDELPDDPGRSHALDPEHPHAEPSPPRDAHEGPEDEPHVLSPHHGDDVHHEFPADDGGPDDPHPHPHGPEPAQDPDDPFGLVCVGDVEEDASLWHQQARDDTCAVVAQEFVLNSTPGHHYTEEELRQEALEHGWYVDGGGTPAACVGNLLELHGVEIERHTGATIGDIMEQLHQGHKVIVSVDADEIWQPGQDYEHREILGDTGCIPGADANHAVEVIGVDHSDPDHPYVILNDSGTPGGGGERVAEADFFHAWDDSDHFMINTVGEPIGAV